MMPTAPIKTTFETKDYRISRHGAMNTAVAIVALRGTLADRDAVTDVDLKRRLMLWAEWVLRYIEVPRP